MITAEALKRGERTVPCMVDTGEYTPFRNLPTEPLDRFVELGKEGLYMALQKGLAELYADGRIIFNRDFFPFWGDPISHVRSYMTAPRVLIGDTDGTTHIVPAQHPMEYLMQKATVTSGDTGAFNAIYGAMATIQVAQQQNFFSALPKRPYNRYGFRAVSTAAKSSSVGIAEGASVPTAVEPIYVEIGVGLKEVSVVTEMSTRLELYSTRDDTITFGGNAQVVFTNFLNALDTDLLQDYDTLPGYNTETIDRVTASTAATTALGYTTGDEDLYGIDRSANSWFDSNIYYDASADRDITISLLDGMYAACYPYWGADLGNKIWVTKPNTYINWSLLEGTKQRFGQETVQFTYTQGVQPVIGQAGGFKVSHYNTWPIILDANVYSDTVGRVYLLDLNHTGMLVGRPIEAIQGNHPLYLQAYVNRLAFYGIMELFCDLPKADAQLRDLK